MKPEISIITKIKNQSRLIAGFGFDENAIICLSKIQIFFRHNYN